MAQLLGRAYIKVDGALLRTNTGAKIDLGGTMRSAVVGNAVHGYAESIKQSSLECEISLAAGDSLESYRNVKDATITFEADTGQVYVIRNAWLTEPPVVNDSEGGKIALKFEGQPAEESV